MPEWDQMSDEGILDRMRTVPPGHRGRPEPGLVEVPDTHLGRKVRLARDQSAVALIDAKGKSQQARVAAVHAQVIVPPDAFDLGAGVTNRRAPVSAILQWGQGGATFEARIDLRTGICATFVASSVNLNAIFEPRTVAPPGTDNRALYCLVAAAVVWGDGVPRSRATRTLPPVEIPIAGTATFEVPPFARALTIYTTVAAFYAAASASTITFHGGPLVTDDPELNVLAGTIGPQQLTFDGILLSGNTRFVTITNAAGVALPVQLTFALEL